MRALLVALTMAAPAITAGEISPAFSQAGREFLTDGNG